MTSGDSSAMPAARIACSALPIRISVVVPVYNEAENISPLAHEVIAALQPLDGGFELILVDDASTDESAAVVRGLTHPAVVGVFHNANCGQSAAVASGFRAAQGEWIATLDGDGQNDPGDLPDMVLRARAEGVDCVTGVRARRRDNLVRRASSRVANSFRDFVTGDRVSDSGCGIRVIRRAALAEVPVFNGMHRFLPTLLRAQGFVVVEHPVNHRERLRGVSKYGVGNRAWRGIRDCFGVRWYLKRAVRGDRLCVRESR